MSGMSRRDLLRASAGAAAVAVPMSALSGGGFAAAAGASQAGGAAAHDDPDSVDDVQLDLSGPVIFSVRDVQSGEVSILHGMQEVVVKDRQLVSRIIRAARARRAV